MRKDIEVSSSFRSIKFGRDYIARSRITKPWMVSRWRHRGELMALRIKFARVNNSAVP